MCTLTYRLMDQGYQLFFNRDEQITRPQANPPALNPFLKSIYPVDPTGGGTWIAAHESGVSLALLNFYQAQIDPNLKQFTSRGVIIPHLLKYPHEIDKVLKQMDLTVFQAFQLCVFEHDFSAQTAATARQYIWNGQSLSRCVLSALDSLPITSSGVDFETVSAYRKKQFTKMMVNKQVTEADFMAYHQHQGALGKCSVKMYREDAKTVSFTKITVNQSKALGNKIKIEYMDYLSEQPDSWLALTL
ncbi:NRDE family protein [Psychromonas sp.]|nr:NRDE family protein [Psychromonas sp.]